MDSVNDFTKLIIERFGGLTINEIMRPCKFTEIFFYAERAADYQRHYVQTGPWAELLQESRRECERINQAII